MADDEYTIPHEALPDSNVVLEALPLKDLSWANIDSIGPILLLVTREVDAKKDGRLGTRARDFNRLMAPIATTGQPVVISGIAARGNGDWHVPAH